MASLLPGVRETETPCPQFSVGPDPGPILHCTNQNDSALLEKVAHSYINIIKRQAPA